LPSRPHPNEAGHERGRHIERRLFDSLAQAQHNGRITAFLQPDALVIPNAGPPFLVEVKGQAAFEPPPFRGHGLPVSQAIRYEQVRLSTRLRTLLIVYDDDGRHHAWLDTLEHGQHFDTRGTIKTPRRIYPLTGFRHAA